MLKSIQENLVAQIEGGFTKDIMPTANEFSIEVERFASEKKCELMDALTLLVEEYRMDEIDIPKLLTKALKEKIGIEQGIIKTVAKVLV